MKETFSITILQQFVKFNKYFLELVCSNSYTVQGVASVILFANLIILIFVSQHNDFQTFHKKQAFHKSRKWLSA